MRYVAYPDPDAVLEEEGEVGEGVGKEDEKEVKEQAETRAAAAFQAVIADAANIEYDHYLLYYTREFLFSLWLCLWVVGWKGS